MVITAASDLGGYLVLADEWFRGWTACVDGQDAQVERADYAFRVVRLESGRHEVEFRYCSGSVRLGLTLSGLAALATVALGGRPQRRKPAEGS